MLTAQDIMTREVITVGEDATVRELATLFLTKNISGAPVVDAAGRVIGVVTESDLIFQNKKVHLPTAVAILDAFIFLESPGKTEKELKRSPAPGSATSARTTWSVSARKPAWRNWRRSWRKRRCTPCR